MSLEYRLLRSFGWWLMLLAPGILSACAQAIATGDVSGSVKLGGKAPELDGLQINFVSENGGVPVSAKVNRDGSFTATGVPAGKVLVGLTYFTPETQTASARRASARKLTEENPELKKDPNALRQVYAKMLKSNSGGFHPPIPERCLNPHTSGMTVVIEARKQNYLTWDVQQ